MRDFSLLPIGERSGQMSVAAPRPTGGLGANLRTRFGVLLQGITPSVRGPCNRGQDLRIESGVPLSNRDTGAVKREVRVGLDVADGVSARVALPMLPRSQQLIALSDLSEVPTELLAHCNGDRLDSESRPARGPL